MRHPPLSRGSLHGRTILPSTTQEKSPITWWTKKRAKTSSGTERLHAGSVFQQQNEEGEEKIP